jgi:hypothetical protein
MKARISTTMSHVGTSSQPAWTKRELSTIMNHTGTSFQPTEITPYPTKTMQWSALKCIRPWKDDLSNTMNQADIPPFYQCKPGRNECWHQPVSNIRLLVFNCDGSISRCSGKGSAAISSCQHQWITHVVLGKQNFAMLAVIQLQREHLLPLLETGKSNTFDQ